MKTKTFYMTFMVLLALMLLPVGKAHAAWCAQVTQTVIYGLLDFLATGPQGTGMATSRQSPNSPFEVGKLSDCQDSNYPHNEDYYAAGVLADDGDVKWTVNYRDGEVAKADIYSAFQDHGLCCIEPGSGSPEGCSETDNIKRKISLCLEN